jgi:dihydroflavonol-4-reductase
VNVFVTGGTGFIGGHLLRCLAARGHQSRCLARPTSDTSVADEVGADIIRGDLGDRDALSRGMAACDWVIHLAGTYEFWVRDRSEYRWVNVEGTRNVMECALDAGVAKVVHVSTAGVWGFPADWPVSEDTPYGRTRTCEYFDTKYEGEQVAWQLYQTRRLPLVVVYPGAVLGPDDPKASGDYIRRLVEHRLPATVFDNAPFPFVHVRDVVEAIARAAEKPGNVGAKYIIAKYNPTFGELNALISDESGAPLPRLHLPDWMAMVTARFLEGVADVTGRPPLLGMSVDQARTMRKGAMLDGSRAETDLGLTYTPLRTCVHDAVATLRTRH